MKDIPKWLEDSLAQSPGFSTDAPVPDIDTDECAATVPHRRVVDLSLADVNESIGFNPYDTGVKRTLIDWTK